MPDEILFEVESPLGYSVTLRRRTWEDLASRRPEIAGHEDNVSLCIREPHVVVDSCDGRMHYYRMGHGEGKTAGLLPSCPGSRTSFGRTRGCHCLVHAGDAKGRRAMVQEALDDSTRKTGELLTRMRAAEKPALRIQREGLELHYSAEDDYLTATIGEPLPSVSVPAGPVYLLVDPDSGRINALEVPFFSEAWGDGQLQGAFWEMTHRLISAGHTTVYIPPSRELERAGEALKDLVPA